MNIRRQLRFLYAYDLSACFRIADAVWVLFLLQRGYSLAQVGIAEGVFHVTSVICEVPSGMAADLFGRRRTLMASCLAAALSALLMGADAGFAGICAAMAFSAAGCNLISGTEDALLYDSLLEAGEEERFGQIRAALSVIGRLGAAAACLASPAAVALGYRNTYAVSLALSLAALAFSSLLAQPQVTDRQRARMEHPFAGAAARLREHCLCCAAFLTGHPATVCKLLADAAVACPTYLLAMFLQDHLTASGWPAAWIGLPLLIQRISGAAGAWIGGRRKRRLFYAVLGAGTAGGIGTFLAGSGAVWMAVLGACLAQGCEGFTEVQVSAAANREFASDQRATMVSVDSMMYSVLMIGASPLLGAVSGAWGTACGFRLLGLLLAAGTILSCIGYRVYAEKDAHGGRRPLF